MIMISKQGILCLLLKLQIFHRIFFFSFIIIIGNVQLVSRLKTISFQSHLWCKICSNTRVIYRDVWFIWDIVFIQPVKYATDAWWGVKKYKVFWLGGTWYHDIANTIFGDSFSLFSFSADFHTHKTKNSLCLMFMWLQMVFSVFYLTLVIFNEKNIVMIMCMNEEISIKKEHLGTLIN